MEAAKALSPSPGIQDLSLAADPSPSEKGFFYPDYVLPDYNDTAEPTYIRSIGQPGKHRDYGTTYLEEWSMHDEAGTRYRVARCLADQPISDVWVIKDTAWSTQPEGVNIDVARKLMKLGFNVLIKGPEVDSSLPLSQSAYNTHQILNAMEQRGNIDARYITVEGYSRGSMIGFGVNAYAALFGRRVLYSNLTDPCVARPIKADLETVKKAATLPLDIALLELDVMRSVLDIRRGRYLLDTIDPTPRGLRQFVRTGGPLMNGEAGMMAARTPLDMQATIAFFRRCRINDAELYEAILADRSGVRFVRPEGGHGGGLDQRIIGNIAVRFERLGSQLADGRQPDELDFQEITHGGGLAR
jgi:hypothetical protein